MVNSLEHANVFGFNTYTPFLNAIGYVPLVSIYTGKKRIEQIRDRAFQQAAKSYQLAMITRATLEILCLGALVFVIDLVKEISQIIFKSRQNQQLQELIQEGYGE